MLNKKVIKYLGIGFLFFILFITIVVNYLDYLKLEKEHKYTTCLISKLHVRGSGGINLIFQYSVNQEKFDNIYVSDNIKYSVLKKKYLHRKFLLKFQPSNPKNCKIMLDYPVANGVTAPPDGWDSIPIISKKTIK